MRSSARLRLLVGLTMLFALVPIQAAFAHAQLLSTEPMANAVLETAPDELTLTFNEPVSPLAMKLIGPDGVATELTGTTTGLAVEVQVPELGDGTHVLSWRVVSTDGHPIGGSLVFSFGQVTAAAEVDATDPAVGVALWAGKALLFLGLFAGVGGAMFAAVAPVPGGARRMAAGLSVLGLAMAATTFVLQGLDALGLPLASIIDDTAWAAGMSTSYGPTAIVAGIAFLMALVALGVPRGRPSEVLGLAAGTLAALSLALSGHASAAAPQWLTRPAVFFHIAGVIFWVGALWPLRSLLRERSETSDRALASFSAGIPFAVAPLVLSGATLAVIQMGWPGPQWVTPYGFILGAKLGLLVVLFGLAIWNRLWLTRPALAGDRVARVHLRRSIGFEMALIVVILCLVAGWRFTPPPRALATVPVVVAAEPLMLHMMDASTMAMVMIEPGSAGPVALDISLTNFEGVPKEAQAIVVTLSSPALGIEPIKAEATQTEGRWRVRGLMIPVAGEWIFELDVRVSRFELIRMQAPLLLSGP